MGNSTHNSWDPGGLPTHAPGGVQIIYFHWSGAIVQGLVPYPQWNAQIGSKGRSPGKNCIYPCKPSPHRGRPLTNSGRQGKSVPTPELTRGGGSLSIHPYSHPHTQLGLHSCHPNLWQEGGRWATILTPKRKSLRQGVGDHRGEAGIQCEHPRQQASRP